MRRERNVEIGLAVGRRCASDTRPPSYRSDDTHGNPPPSAAKCRASRRPRGKRSAAPRNGAGGSCVAKSFLRLVADARRRERALQTEVQQRGIQPRADIQRAIPPDAGELALVGDDDAQEIARLGSRLQRGAGGDRRPIEVNRIGKHHASRAAPYRTATRSAAAPTGMRSVARTVDATRTPRSGPNESRVPAMAFSRTCTQPIGRPSPPSTVNAHPAARPESTPAEEDAARLDAVCARSEPAAADAIRAATAVQRTKRSRSGRIRSAPAMGASCLT